MPDQHLTEELQKPIINKSKKPRLLIFTDFSYMKLIVKFIKVLFSYMC